MIDSRIYSIYDVKSGMYGPAMTFVNDSTAVRSFQEMLTSGDKNSLLSLYPADYILFCLGVFNQQSGVIDPLPAPMNVMSGMEAFTKACNEAEERRARFDRLNGINSSSVKDISNKYKRDDAPLSDVPISNNEIVCDDVPVSVVSSN